MVKYAGHTRRTQKKLLNLIKNEENNDSVEMNIGSFWLN